MKQSQRLAETIQRTEVTVEQTLFKKCQTDSNQKRAARDASPTADELAASIGQDRRIVSHIDPDMHMRCPTEMPHERRTF